jgi:uncharacterized glyoxalase superfamily protein PhnB
MEDTSLRWVEVGIPGDDTAIILVRGYAGWSAERLGSFTGVVLRTDDIKSTCEELKAKGVEFSQEPEDQPWGKMGQFRDGDGNQYVLVER